MMQYLTCAQICGMSERWFRSDKRCFLAVLLILWGAGSSATPPLTPWQELENRVEAEGLPAIRAVFQTRIDSLVATLGDQPPDSTQAFWNRTMAVAQIFEYASSWAGVEGRALQKTVPATVTDDSRESFGRIIHATGLALGAYAELKDIASSIEVSQTEAELARFGPIAQNVSSLDRDVNALGMRVASFALAAGGGQLLQDTFNAFQEGFKDETRSYLSPGEFEQDPPDLDRAFGSGLQGRLREPVSIADVADISEMERVEVRVLIEKVLSAIVAESEPQLTSTYVSADIARTHFEAIANATVKLISFDLSNARFQFERTSDSEFSVTVSDIEMIAEENNSRRTLKGRQVYHVDFGSGRALIKGEPK